jgi:hypothetical protein
MSPHQPLLCLRVDPLVNGQRALIPVGSGSVPLTLEVNVNSTMIRQFIVISFHYPSWVRIRFSHAGRSISLCPIDIIFLIHLYFIIPVDQDLFLSLWKVVSIPSSLSQLDMNPLLPHWKVHVDPLVIDHLPSFIFIPLFCLWVLLFFPFYRSSWIYSCYDSSLFLCPPSFQFVSFLSPHYLTSWITTVRNPDYSLQSIWSKSV